RTNLATLRQTLSQRRQILASLRKDLESRRTRELTDIKLEIKDYRRKYLQVSEILMQSRRLLVRELVSVFRLRRVQRTGGSKNNGGSGASSSHAGSVSAASGGAVEEPPEYRIINVGFSTYGDYLNYPRQKFNAAVGHIVHMTILLAHYLNITLPFEFVNRGAKSYAKANYPRMQTEMSNVPLYLTDNNIERFTTGLSMLNYDIAYLCHTQGVQIKFQQVPHSLENLAMCCQATFLGRDTNQPHRSWLTNDPSSTPPHPDPDPFSDLDHQFILDFSKVVRLHTALRKIPRPQSRTFSINAYAPSSSSSADTSTSGAISHDHNLAAIRQALEEEDSGDEDAGWHLVDSPILQSPPP
ncbi:hypothetical protein HK102_001244, partial [Quaeritorhiza haematococci]